MSDVVVRHEQEGQRFVAELEGEEAELTYRRPDARTLDLHHTWTPPALRGRGVAGALVRLRQHPRTRRCLPGGVVCG